MTRDLAASTWKTSANGRSQHPPNADFGIIATATMSDPIDPRLQYASSLPPRTLSQSYPAGPALQNSAAGHQPYYLPTTTHGQLPPLAQAAPPSNLDPALADVSPAGPDGSADEDDNEHEGDLEGYAISPNTAIDVLILRRHQETPGSGKSPGDFKRPRACDSCRGLKVCRCFIFSPQAGIDINQVRCDQERPDQPCRRCAKANRQW